MAFTAGSPRRLTKTADRVRRFSAALLIAAGLTLLAISVWQGVARAALAAMSFGITTNPVGGVVDFGIVDPGQTVTRAGAVTLRVGSELEWRLQGITSALPGTYVLEERPSGGVTWTALAPTAVTLKDTQLPCAPTDLSEDFRLTADWDLPPGLYSITVTYALSFTDQTPPTGTLAINGGAAYATSPLVTLNLTATDDSGVVDAVSFTNDDPAVAPTPVWSAWQDYLPASPTASWTLPSPDGAKSVWAKYRDRAGNETLPLAASIILDTSFPVISGIAVANIQPTTADISWLTSEPASTQVDYGLSVTYGLSSPLDTSPLTSHLVSLSGLAPGTLYHFRVRSADPAGNATVSADNTFWTRCAPPVLSVTMTPHGSRWDVNLTWTPTTGATSYRVERKNTVDPVTSFLQIATPTAPSYIDLDQVSPFSLDYRVIAVNATAGTESAPSNVVTAVAGPHTTPPVISAVTASPGQTTCAITWTTDEPATSQVSYRTGTNPWTTTTVSSNLVTIHSVNLGGLTAGTLYDFYVISTDQSGNTSQSIVQQFTTQTGPTAPPPPANLRLLRVIGQGNKVEIGWDAAPTATGYRVYSRDLLTGPGPWQLVSDQTTTSYIDGRYGPHGVYSYEYYVVAYNAVGVSGESNHLIYSQSG
jgi:hypothetical protein